MGRRAPRGPGPWPADAVALRRAYATRLDDLVTVEVECGPPLALRVLSFSSDRDVPEQVASLRSFLVHVGVPLEYRIVSDGSHSGRSRDLLHAVHRCVSVVDWQKLVRPGLPRVLSDYARIDWRGRRLAVLVSLAGEQPFLYTDADILFFAGARELRNLGGERPGGARYLRDCNGDRRFLDDRLLLDDREGRESINGGFMFLSEAVDWTPAVGRLEGLRWRPSLFTDQTVIHLTLHGARARPFDRSRYVMADDDSCLVEDPHVGSETALRHYVTPVRHKFWSTLSRLPEYTA